MIESIKFELCVHYRQKYIFLDEDTYWVLEKEWKTFDSIYNSTCRNI